MRQYREDVNSNWSRSAALHPENGIAAMQSVNVEVLNPLFLAVFLGTAAACLFLVNYSIAQWAHAGASAPETDILIR
jgi:uncharacterized membrane protein